jgi:HlyD family secretion protein
MGSTAQERVDRAVTEARVRQAECDAAKAALVTARDRARLARAQLERTRLLAPFAGIVAEVNGERGEYLTPSPPGIPTPPAVDLVDDRCFYVAAPIDEVDAPAIAVGMPARIGMDAFGKQRFDGRVRRIGAYVLDREKQARTVDVEVEFLHPEAIPGLLAGYSADAEVVLEVRRDVLRVPTQAVIEGRQVYRLQPGTGRVEKHTFEAGVANWDFVEVRSGLSLDDQVVLSVDAKGLADGVPVRPAAEEP